MKIGLGKIKIIPHIIKTVEYLLNAKKVYNRCYNSLLNTGTTPAPFHKKRKVSLVTLKFTVQRNKETSLMK